MPLHVVSLTPAARWSGSQTQTAQMSAGQVWRTVGAAGALAEAAVEAAEAAVEAVVAAVEAVVLAAAAAVATAEVVVEAVAAVCCPG
jgi:hypothetical protein